MRLTAVSPKAVPKKILVVEDEGLIASDLKRRLEGLGYSVPAIANSAAEAVRFAVSHAPDLILMDIKLKGDRDGIEASEEIRRMLDIPIIFLTAHADPGTLGRARIAEPLGYIVKPFGTVNLQAQIEMAHYKHQIERSLRRSEAWLSATLSGIGDAVIATDPEGTIEFMNPVAERLTGWELAAAKGEMLLDVFNVLEAKSRDVVHNPVPGIFDPATPDPIRGEYLLFRRGTSASCVVECVISPTTNEDGPVGVVVSFRDVTAQREMEKQASQERNMETVSIMAGALAHDFNNLLTVILAYAEMIPSDPDNSAEAARQILRAGQTAAALTRKLLTVSRGTVLSTEVLDLNAAIRDSAKMLTQILGSACSLRIEAAPIPLWIGADEIQLQQILINLAINARDSMTGEGEFSIHTKLADSGMVEILFQDNGCGMSEVTKARIFEPFFSSKGVQGNGLGMTIVHSVVRQWKGTIAVESEPGNGTVFRIRLPLASGDPKSDEEYGKPVSPSSQQGSRTVLLVEDNDEIRRLLHTSLERAGFQTIEANSGEAALTLMTIRDEPLDLLITDVMMSRMTGPELAEKCLLLSPATRVLFLSGYSGTELNDNPLMRSGQAEFLAKPITAKQLTSKVLAVLDRRDGES